MARPIRDGIEYFSFDTDFFTDDKIKLIRSEFGAKGIVVLMYLFCEIYRGKGYYKVWDEDSCILMSDGVACGCVPDFISQVVQRCVKRSLFDDKLFNVHKILTSPSIQRRYLRACSTRDEIRIIKEYWLLNIDDKKDVPAGILKKVTFTNETFQNNPVSLQNNPVDLQISTQRKVKESKVKKNKENPSQLAATGFAKGNPELLKALSDYDCMRKQIKKPMTERARQLLISELQKYPKDQWMDMVNAAIMHNWLSVYPIGNKPQANISKPKRDTSYDIESFEKMASDGKLMEK